ncbi:hypothetical protein CHS0354_019604 [Potamilus streckersoni]|uniref:Uncharacterized protein n=1 Tax=Potamilus streckersoni TaxID=2493646 RepID=A0AAE0T957_9BIVA|nr:hypothetical protein CHS0354_019604 [Potamilus streckersoni]
MDGQEQLMYSESEYETSSSQDQNQDDFPEDISFVSGPDVSTGIEDEETDGVNTQTTVCTGDVHPWDTSMVDMNTGVLSMGDINTGDAIFLPKGGEKGPETETFRALFYG